MATLAVELPIYRELTPGQRVLRRLVSRRAAMAGLVVVVAFVRVPDFDPRRTDAEAKPAVAPITQTTNRIARAFSFVWRSRP